MDSSGASGSSRSGSSRNGTRTTNSTKSSKSLASTIMKSRKLTDTEYCLRISNYLISSLGLTLIPPLRDLGDLTMEVLIRIHCSLLGIDFSKEFIPSTNPTEDAQRVILSLKDLFGADKFDALEPAKIASKDPIQLRFLLENYHVIHNYIQNKESKGKLTHKSPSGHHLSVPQESLSESDITKNDSFFIFPPPASATFDSTKTTNFSSEPTSTNTDTTGTSSEPTSRSEGGTTTGSSDFKTVENIMISVYDPSSEDETRNDSSLSGLPNLSDMSKVPSKEYTNYRKPPVSKKQEPKYAQRDYLDIPNSKGASDIPDMSSIKESPTYKVQRTLESEISPFKSPQRNKNEIRPVSANKTSTPKRSARADQVQKPTAPTKSPKHSSNQRDKTDKSVKSLMRKRNFEDSLTPSSSNESIPRQRHDDQRKPVATKTNPKTRSSTEDALSSDADSDALSVLRDIHQDIRDQLAESLTSIQDDIEDLKSKKEAEDERRKYVQEYEKKVLPNLRWLMPVDARFPYYRRGIIIPKCRPFKSKRRPQRKLVICEEIENETPAET